jgi:peptide-methionine (R)-S-oxide reductase
LKLFFDLLHLCLNIKIKGMKMKDGLFFVGLSIIVVVLIFATIAPGLKKTGIIHAQKNRIKNTEGLSMSEKINKTDEEWKEILSEEEYRVLRKKGTERPFTGEYNEFKENGVFTCAACGSKLFSSETKYNSGSGWPSFWAPIGEGQVKLEEDNSLFMKRTEVLCNRCGGHLGHVFEDGPAPTNLRYCINSISLDFEKKKTEKDNNNK